MPPLGPVPMAGLLPAMPSESGRGRRVAQLAGLDGARIRGLRHTHASDGRASPGVQRQVA
jgi:hypothetical protein